MRKVILWTVAAAFLLGVFGTAILSHIQLLPALPDLILILVVYIALYNGTAAGITAGFFSGLIFDFLSLAPMGLHSFVFTVLGFLLRVLFGQSIQVYNLLAVPFWIEVAENSLCSPPLFMLLGLFPNAFEIRKL